MCDLEKIVKWAGTKDAIKVILLTGSLASKGCVDELSDYDIAVFGTNFSFIEDDVWLQQIDDYLVCIHDHFQLFSYHISTRLTIFNPGFKVDFSFHPMEELEEIISSKVLPDSYNIGYTVLLDKDCVTEQLPAASYKGFIVKKPTHEEFQKNVNEFWFEVYHVAKYLKRGDLWSVKFRDWSAKQWLLQMLQWDSALLHDWNISYKNDGKEMQKWLPKDLWDELNNCFAPFDEANSTNALKNTMNLYRRLSTGMAKALGFRYNENLDSSMSAFVHSLG
jgi:aminoglycoside 6-adenylyltransferase